MHQEDIERFAFLYLCGEHDRALLLGKEKMSFSDFERLIYITDFLGLNNFSLEIWSKYAKLFSKQFRELENLNVKSTDTSVVSGYTAFRTKYETEGPLYERWIREFHKQIPEKRIKKQLEAYWGQYFC